jgi:hypothetical protein
MEAILTKVRSNHSRIADKYEGIVETLPKVGDSFILWNVWESGKEKRLSDAGTWLKTTPITSLVKLNDRVYEFDTKNSRYSLELIDTVSVSSTAPSNGC